MGCADSSSVSDAGLDAVADRLDATVDSSVVPDTLTVDVTPDVGSDVPTDVPSLPFRFRIGNALADGATICVQDFEGGNVRIPPVGLLPRGAVSAYSERPMGFVRVSWTLNDRS